MATPIEVPDCVRKLLEFLYPTVDWDRVIFFSGLPWWVSSTTAAITIPNPLGLSGYRVYLGDNTDFCKKASLNTIVHEAFHVQQFMGIAGGYGIGWLRPGFFKYFVCLFASGYEDSPYEEAAYAQESAFDKCHTVPVCDCTSGEPIFNPVGLEVLKTCNEKLIVTKPRVPSCGKWWSFLLALLVVPLLAILLFFAHLLDLLSCTYLQFQSQQCIDWGTSARDECNQWADQGHEECTQWADEGYNTCSQWADWGYNNCCTWWPCSWGCQALVWVSNMVCVATVWVAHLVCHVAIWVANFVCLLWVSIIEVICLIWVTVLRTILLCWWR